MKNLLKILTLCVLGFFIFSAVSCRDDDPVDNDFFVGTYSGAISYNDGNSTTATDNGKVTVVKIASGTKYNFAFSNGIPDLTGVEFQKTGDHTLINVGSNANALITINENDLDIVYNKDGKTWFANCSR